MYNFDYQIDIWISLQQNLESKDKFISILVDWKFQFGMAKS